MGAGVLIWCYRSHLSYWSLEVQHGTSWQRTLRGSEKKIVTVHKDEKKKHNNLRASAQ